MQNLSMGCGRGVLHFVCLEKTTQNASRFAAHRRKSLIDRWLRSGANSQRSKLTDVAFQRKPFQGAGSAVLGGKSLVKWLMAGILRGQSVIWAGEVRERA